MTLLPFQLQRLPGVPGEQPRQSILGRGSQGRLWTGSPNSGPSHKTWS